MRKPSKVGVKLSAAAKRLLRLTPTDPYAEVIGNAPVVMVPGLGGSGEDHWQTLWEKERPEFRRVTQKDWQTRDLDAWAVEIAAGLCAVGTPAFVAAHGFGCLATLRAALAHRAPIRAALLVAPIDPDAIGLGSLMPGARLSFPSALVASTNDPWLKLVKAGSLATRWGSRLIAYRNAGHINAESGYGPWPDLARLLRDLDADVARHVGRTEAPELVASDDPAHAAR